MALKIHGIDPNSDQFYLMARDYAICPDVETIAKIHKIPIQKILILLEDNDFNEMVSNFRKQSSEKGKDAYRQYVDSKKFYMIKKLEEIGDNDNHKNQVESIKRFMEIAGELGRGSQSATTQKAKVTGNNVRIEVNKDFTLNPDYEEDDFEDE